MAQDGTIITHNSNKNKNRNNRNSNHNNEDEKQEQETNTNTQGDEGADDDEGGGGGGVDAASSRNNSMSISSMSSSNSLLLDHDQVQVQMQVQALPHIHMQTQIPPQGTAAAAAGGGGGRRRRGSALHRNNQRSQRLLSLNTKERIRRLLGTQFESKGKESRDLEGGGGGGAAGRSGAGRSGTAVSTAVSTAGSELAILKETEPFLYYQVQKEDLRNTHSAKLKEINKLIEPYAVASGQSLRAQEFPLEVRLKNVSYTVVDETAAAAAAAAAAAMTPGSPSSSSNFNYPGSSQKIQTVYNTSVFYSAYTWLRRLLLLVVPCQDNTATTTPTSTDNNGNGNRNGNGNHNKNIQVPRKHVLEDINLIIQPGKQYLLLGPPGSGKSTLLKTIAGLIRHDEDDHDNNANGNDNNDNVGQRRTTTTSKRNNANPSLQGEILYNGRSLKVRFIVSCAL
jgi:ABC-type multidrug transport system fused ATPase/permease subunit